MRAHKTLAGPLTIGAVTIPNRVLSAPMSGVSDLPFRSRAVAHGAGMAVSEMVASGELSQNRPESRQRLRLSNASMVHCVQLAGRNPVWMAEAARIAAGEGADIIDINMGCPAKKVIGGYAGSALMREPDRALVLIEAVAGAVDIPVTVKMRLGWDDKTVNAAEIAQRAECAGVAMVTVHGRTRCQFYKGRADWPAIARVKQAISIPLVANGDVENAGDAIEIMKRSGADAVMVGRGQYGRPWLAGDIASHFGFETAVPPPQTGGQMLGYVLDHYDDMLVHYGRERGCRHARKHLGWYMDRYAVAGGETLRPSIMRSHDPAEVIELLGRLEWRGEARSERKLAA